MSLFTFIKCCHRLFPVCWFFLSKTTRRVQGTRDSSKVRSLYMRLTCSDYHFWVIMRELVLIFSSQTFSRSVLNQNIWTFIDLQTCGPSDIRAAQSACGPFDPSMSCVLFYRFILGMFKWQQLSISGTAHDKINEILLELSQVPDKVSRCKVNNQESSLFQGMEAGPQGDISGEFMKNSKFMVCLTGEHVAELLIFF